MAIEPLVADQAPSRGSPLLARLASAGEAVQITARFVDESGAALSNARAYFLPSGPTLDAAKVPHGFWVIRTGMVIGNYHYFTTVTGVELPTLPQALSNTDGYVAIPSRHVPVENERGLGEGDGMPRAALLVVCEGRATRTVWIDALQPGLRELGDVKLEAHARLTGRALDEDGRPLAGVRVRVWREGIQPSTVDLKAVGEQPFVPELMQAVTAADGRFALDGLWPGEGSLELKMRDRVRQEVPIKLVATQALEVGDVTVPSGSSIAGHVRDANGAPLVGAKVSVVDGEIRGSSTGCVGYGFADDDDSIHAELEQAEDNDFHESVLTDTKGAFHVGGLNSPTHSVYATADGFEPTRLRPVAPGAHALELVLQREAVLQLHIVDSVTNAPITNASVRVIRESGIEYVPHDIELRIEPSGPAAFIAHGAGPLSQRIIASAPGHAAESIPCSGIAPAASAEIVVRLGPESVLGGVIRDDQGAPMPDAIVELHEPDNLRTATLTAKSDESGAFRFEQLDGLTTLVVAVASGYPETEPLPVTLADGERREDLELRLPAPARIHGTVFAADATPESKANVSIDVPPFGEFKYGDLSSRFVPWVRVDGQGRYAFENLRPGEYQLEVHGHPSVAFTLAEGEDRLLDFTAVRGVSVHGRVTSAGEPVVGVPVTASNDPNDRSQALGWVEPAITDASGSYLLELPISGEMEVFAKPDGSPESEHRTLLTVPGQDVQVDLELPSAHISGRVVDDVSGAPIEGLEISLHRDINLSAASCRTAPDGRFQLDWLPADTYRLRVTGMGKSEHGFGDIAVPLEPRDIALAEGASIDGLSLTVCRGGILRGTVRLHDGNVVGDGIMVWLVRTSNGRIVPGVSAVWSSEIDSDEGMRYEESDDPIWARTATQAGRFEFIALPAGEYRLLTGKATPEEVRDLGQSATLAEHQILELDLFAR